MGKRSDFERIPNDLYKTPWEAMRFLAPYLPESFTFCEPCAGDGRLIRHLERLGGRCVAAYDIEPMAPGIVRADATHMLGHHLGGAELIITNPPWTREVLHRLLRRFALLRPTWALWDANWPFSEQAVPFMNFAAGRNVVRRIVAIGRLNWIEGTDMSGKDDSAWYEIGPPSFEPPRFYPRLT